MGYIYFITFLLFAVGLYGVLSKRNLIFILMSLEIMFNSSLILLVASSSMRRDAEGAAFFFVILAVAACEVAIGLSLCIALFRQRKSLDVAALDRLSE